MKAKELSLLVVHKDKVTRQLLASYLCDFYKCVTNAAPEEADDLLAQKPFDLMIVEKVSASSPEEKQRVRSAPGKLPAVAAVIRSDASGNRYELMLINQDAANCTPNPFELVLLRALIERAELGFSILSIEKVPHEPRT